MRVFSFPRGFCVGIYATNFADACEYVITHAKVNILLVENNAQLQKILSVTTAPTPPTPSWVCHCLAVIHIFSKNSLGLSWWSSGEESACQRRRHEFDPWSRKIPRHGATKSVHQNYGAHALQPEGCNH